MASSDGWEDVSEGDGWEDVPDAPSPDAAPKDHGTTIGEALLHHGTGGYFSDWSDELVGKLSRLDPRASRPGAAYRMPDGSTRFMETPDQTDQVRTESERQELQRTQEDHPVAAFLANVGGSMARDMALQGVGIPAMSFPGMVATGALSGAGAADENTPGGRLGGAAIGGAVSAAGYGVGKYVAAPVVRKVAQVGLKGVGALADPVRDFVEKRISGAVAQEAAEQAAKKDKLIRSAAGGLGGESAAAIKTLERLTEAAADENLPPQLRKAAADHLASPEMQALKERALGNYVEKAPEQMGRIQSAEQKLEEARALDVGKATEDALANPGKKHIFPRLWTLGHRIAPAALAAAGGLVGGPAGAAVGGAVGAGYALIQGRPGVIIRNMLREPAVRKAFWEKTLALIPDASAAHQSLIPVLERAAEDGEKKFTATAFVLAQRSPEARALFDAMAKIASPDESNGDAVAER
jgi:hypothetical protein